MTFPSFFGPQPTIVVAPSGFKESLSATGVAAAIAQGVRSAHPRARVLEVPIPDGGEGTVEILAARPGACMHSQQVTGPVGAPTNAHWVELNGRAVIEMAQAAGLSKVPRDVRNPGITTTYGVGEMIAAALDAGCRDIVIGCGDSGTSDGGAGALSALGARILDASGQELEPGGSALERAASIDISGLHPALHPQTRRASLTLACNIHNVLTGPQGVAVVFGPQKGASPQQVAQLGSALEHWADLLEQTFQGVAVRGPGSGASGGLGAGLMALGAQAYDRFSVLLTPTLAGDLTHSLQNADLVFTAEGAIDFQTPHGKVPAEIARRCAEHSVPVIALGGTLGQGAEDVYDAGITAFQSIMSHPMSLDEAIANCAALLSDATVRCLRMMAISAAHQPAPAA